MATTYRFRDHEEFHRAALHMAVAGALAGLAAHVAGLLFPAFGGLTGPWGLAAVAGAGIYGASPPGTRMRVTDLALLVAVCIGLGVVLHVAEANDRADTLGAGALAAAFAVLVARQGRRIVPTLIACAGAAVLGRYVLFAFMGAGELAHLPPWVTAAASGTAMAFVGVLGLLPRHVEIGRNRVEDAYGACRAQLSGEVRELADRGMAVWTQVDQTLEQESSVRRAIEDSVVRLFDVARKWASVESDGARTPADLLVERMEGIQAKMERIEDPIARGQYEQAHAALAEQLRYLKEISTARERVIARMHHYLAAMERLRFAVINHRSADASRLSTDVQPILDDLKDLGREIDFSSEAMGEVEKQDAVTASARPQA
jgi:hypothetical protein